jgi:hypothetical protein
MGKQAADWLAPGTRNRARAWQVRVSSVSRWPAGAATGPAKSRSASTEGPKAERWLFGPRPAPSPGVPARTSRVPAAAAPARCGPRATGGGSQPGCEDGGPRCRQRQRQLILAGYTGTNG